LLELILLELIFFLGCSSDDDVSESDSLPDEPDDEEEDDELSFLAFSPLELFCGLDSSGLTIFFSLSFSESDSETISIFFLFKFFLGGTIFAGEDLGDCFGDALARGFFGEALTGDFFGLPTGFLLRLSTVDDELELEEELLSEESPEESESDDREEPELEEPEPEDPDELEDDDFLDF